MADSKASDKDSCADSEERGIVDKEGWNRCIFGSVLSITAGVILGTMGTVVLASEVPVLVGTGMGVSMAAAYCGKTFRRSTEFYEEEEPQPTDEDDDDCFDPDPCPPCPPPPPPRRAEKECEMPEEKPEDSCSFNQEKDGYQCTCTCTAAPEDHC